MNLWFSDEGNSHQFHNEFGELGSNQDGVQVVGIPLQLFWKRVSIDLNKQECWTPSSCRNLTAQKLEHGVEMRGTTLWWCCIVQIVVCPLNFGFSNPIDN